MRTTPQTQPDKQAILVVCCSDSRLTAADSIDSWRNRLGFDGPIYEVRCPGGGLALADSSSTFYASAHQSYQLLSQNKPFSRVILAAHEDCAYYRGKYGSLHSDAQDNDDLKRWLIDEAVRNVETWVPGVQIETVYMSFTDHDHTHGDHQHGPDCAPSGQAARGPVSDPLTGPLAYPAGRATQAVLDRFVAERLLASGGSVESIMAAVEGAAGESGAIPAWRVERRVREFIALLQSEGSRFDAEQLRQLARTFVQSYAGAGMPRTTARALMTSLDPDLGAARSRFRRSERTT